MIIENLKASCVNAVACELARPVYARAAISGDAAWFNAVKSCHSEAVRKIDAMTNMELLDLIADVLASD